MAATDPRRRFPVVLTLFAAVAFAILCGLGTWQFQRMQWKRDLLARIEAARTAPPVPIAEALRRAKAGQDVDWMRVEADCLPPADSDAQALLYGLDEGQIAWRAFAVCRLAGAAWPLIVVDRGYSTRDNEVLAPTAVRYPAPGRLLGVLRSPEPSERFEPTPVQPEQIDGGVILPARRPAYLAHLAGDAATPPVHLLVEREDPAVPGLRPAPLPTNISNRHLEYVITWFGLAGALAAVYAAMLIKRLRG